MYANVIIEYGNKVVDKEFTYIVPDKFRNIIKIGHRVLVPFNNRFIEGFVLSLLNKCDCNYELKEIKDICDIEPVLNEEMLHLGSEIQKNILCSKISIFQAMLPKALKAKSNTNIGIKKDRYITLNVSYEEANKFVNNCKYKGQVEIVEKLITDNKILCSRLSSSVSTLIKNGIIREEYVNVDRYKSHISGKYHKLTLNDEQKEKRI